MKRPLSVDFALHTDDDADFKKELIDLMIDNIKELRQALSQSRILLDITPYKKACHKVNSTIGILADPEFSMVVDEIKTSVDNGEKVGLFNSLCSQLIESLE